MSRSRWVWLVVGVFVGVSVGLNLAGFWPQTPIHATATHGESNFAICTGPVDEEVEAIFFLDFLTGDLKAAVLSTQNGKFNAFYEYNVIADLGARGIKNPHFLMVTGVTNLRRGAQAGNLQPGRAVVYVAETTSGQVAAYGIPWMQSRASAGIAQRGALVKLDQMQFRTTAIRDKNDAE